ncbi:MAG: lysophospholipid acyltransferase family protein [Dehalococcoidia bacterium]|nr:lysophospholipid acyltransferase family protein [Dehalococcoidia bacterium]
MPILYWPGRLVVKAVVLLLVDLHVTGIDKVPRHGPVIIASNHLSNADPPVLGTSVGRRVVFMAKQEAMGWPILGLLIRLSGALPVRRFEADLGALRKATEVLHDGKALVMFPEGTRSRQRQLQTGHPGTALIALRSGAPIVPVGISGTENIRFPGVIFSLLRLRRPKVFLAFGDPFFLPNVTRISSDEVNRCTDQIMRRIAALLPPAYLGPYADEADVPPQQTRTEEVG